MFKNTSSQKVAVFAWDNSLGVAKTGDAANISAQISIDGAATAATDDAAPTELDATDAPGIYIFDMLQAETNGDLIVIAPVSSTSDIVLRPVIIYTQTVMRGTDNANTTVPDAAGTAAVPGDAMNLAADAIKAVSYDESTAFPLTAVNGSTLTEAGGDGDHLVEAGGDGDHLSAIPDMATTTELDKVPKSDGAVSWNATALAAIIGIEVDNDGTAISLAGALKLMLATLTGKSSGGGTATIVFRDINDAKNRISATVDADGNRTAVGTRDAT